jgi:hypothetical protein
MCHLEVGSFPHMCPVVLRVNISGALQLDGGPIIVAGSADEEDCSHRGPDLLSWHKELPFSHAITALEPKCDLPVVAAFCKDDIDGGQVVPFNSLPVAGGVHGFIRCVVVIDMVECGRR